jgi:hypothetical protein
MNDGYSKEFLDLLNSVTAKRPRIVIQHILKHGYITSQELKDEYGSRMKKVLIRLCYYRHPQTGQNHGLVSNVLIGKLKILNIA